MEWLFYLGVIMLAAKLGAEVVQRVGISAVIGEIAVGVLLGHSLLNVIPESEIVGALADMGVLFMIFLLGLETKVAHVLEVGLTALLVALGGIVLPFALGYLTGLLTGLTWKTSLFLGAVLTATSVAISARIFLDVGMGRSRVTRTILAAAVIDDSPTVACSQALSRSWGRSSLASSLAAPRKPLPLSGRWSRWCTSWRLSSSSTSASSSTLAPWAAGSGLRCC